MRTPSSVRPSLTLLALARCDASKLIDMSRVKQILLINPDFAFSYSAAELPPEVGMSGEKYMGVCCRSSKTVCCPNNYPWLDNPMGE